MFWAKVPCTPQRDATPPSPIWWIKTFFPQWFELFKIKIAPISWKRTACVFVCKFRINSRYSQGKSTVKTPARAYQKHEYRDLGSWYLKPVLYKWFVYWSNHKNKVVTGKTLVFVIGPFWGSFVWKCCFLNLSTFNWKSDTQTFWKRI